MDCAETVRMHDRDRFILSLFLPEEARRAVHTLLAWNLEIARLHETVSEPMLGFVRLQWWREALDELYEGRVRRHPLLEPLAGAVRVHRIERALFEDVLTARGQDFSDEPPKDIQELENYLRGTSSALLHMMARVLGADSQALDSLGIAWGALGVLRALPHHARHGVLLLPGIMQGASDAAAIGDAPNDKTVQQACAGVLTLAEEKLAEARRAEVPQGLRPLMLYAVPAARWLKRMKKHPSPACRARVGMGYGDMAALYLHARR